MSTAGVGCQTSKKEKKHLNQSIGTLNRTQVLVENTKITLTWPSYVTTTSILVSLNFRLRLVLVIFFMTGGTSNSASVFEAGAA